MEQKVVISGLKLPVRIGCLPGERLTPQILELSLEIDVNFEKCLKSGDPSDSVCYLTLCNGLKSLVSGESEWPLLEQLGNDVIHFIHTNFPASEKISLEIKKFVIPATEWVGIRLSKERDS